MTELDERSAAITQAIDEIDPEFVIQIPSSTLKGIVAHCERRASTRTFAVAREEEGVGIASGLSLAGRRTLMIIQDNGLGNSLTAFTTMSVAYHVPLLVIVSRRGGLGEYNSMIHTFCERVDAIADAAGLRYFVLDSRTPIERWAATITRSSTYAATTHRPVFVFVNLMDG